MSPRCVDGILGFPRFFWAGSREFLPLVPAIFREGASRRSGAPWRLGGLSPSGG